MRVIKMFALTKVNGNRIINIGRKTNLDIDFAIEEGKEEFKSLVSSTLDADGKVIGVIKDNTLVGAYFFDREENSLRLVKEYRTDTDPETEAKVEAEVRDLIRALAVDHNLFSSSRVNKVYFRDEILRNNDGSMITWILFFIILMNLMSSQGVSVLVIAALTALFLASRYLIRRELV
jgi:hypothetical protein